MGNVVREWYEDKKHVAEMNEWVTSKLKIWEREVTAHFPGKANILDIGCGMGREAFALSDMGFAVTGIDISHEAITQVSALSAQQGYSLPFLIFDGYTLPFADATFDVVILWAQTFGLLYGEEYKAQFLSECKRVLRNGGLLSFSCHDAGYVTEHFLQYTEGRKFHPYVESTIYWELFTQQELHGYAEDADFTVLLCKHGQIYRQEDGVVLHCLCRK